MYKIHGRSRYFLAMYGICEGVALFSKDDDDDDDVDDDDETIRDGTLAQFCTHT